MSTTTQVPALLTYAQAAERLNVKVGWLQDAVQARLVPHTRLGRQVRFSEQDLADIVKSSRHAAVRRRGRWTSGGRPACPGPPDRSSTPPRT